MGRKKWGGKKSVGKKIKKVEKKKGGLNKKWSQKNQRKNLKKKKSGVKINSGWQKKIGVKKKGG